MGRNEWKGDRREKEWAFIGLQEKDNTWDVEGKNWYFACSRKNVVSEEELEEKKIVFRILAQEKGGI